MRKIVVFNSVSLDGYYAGPNGEIDWFIHDPEVNIAAHELMNPDTVIFGRVTYQMFEGYWPHVADDPTAPEAARNMADELNQMTKIVFSRTQRDVSWRNSILFNDRLSDQVRSLKGANGEDITIFGSGSIIQQLANEGLIDEYLLAVTPVILGAGKPLFKGVPFEELRLLHSKTYNSGMILLHYATSR